MSMVKAMAEAAIDITAIRQHKVPESWEVDARDGMPLVRQLNQSPVSAWAVRQAFESIFRNHWSDQDGDLREFIETGLREVHKFLS